MYRIDNSTAVPAIPVPAAVGPNPNHYFTKGNPGSGIPATIVDDDWANAIQEEIAYVIEQTGVVLSKVSRTQLRTAILAMITANLAVPATELVAGILEIATDAEAQASTANKAIDGAKLNTAFKGSNQSLAASGYQKFPGGLILQWGITANVPINSSLVHNLPLAFPNSIFQAIATFSADCNMTAQISAMSATQITIYGDGPGASTPVTNPARFFALGN